VNRGLGGPQQQSGQLWAEINLLSLPRSGPLLIELLLNYERFFKIGSASIIYIWVNCSVSIRTVSVHLHTNQVNLIGTTFSINTSPTIMVNSNHQTCAPSDLANKNKGVKCMRIFAQVLTWHENYGQAGKKIAYFCHINSTSRNLNTALWSNCRLPTYTLSCYTQILLDFAHWLVSCDAHLLVSAFTFTQTPGTSREHSRLPRAQGLRAHCVPARTLPTCISLQRNRYLACGMQHARDTAFVGDQSNVVFRQFNSSAIYLRCTVLTSQWWVRTYAKCSTNNTQHVSQVGKEGNY